MKNLIRYSLLLILTPLVVSFFVQSQDVAYGSLEPRKNYNNIIDISVVNTANGYLSYIKNNCQGIGDDEKISNTSIKKRDICKELENRLREGSDEAIGCGDLFYSKDVQKSYEPGADPNRTTKKWYIQAASFAGCFNMVESKLRKVLDNCNISMVKNEGSWESCENMQNRLIEAVGEVCDRFYKESDGKYTLDEGKVATCKNTNLTVKTNTVIKGAPPENNTAKIGRDGKVTIYDKDGKEIRTLDPDTSGSGSSTPGEEDDDTDSNCSGGSMAWLFCPMIEYMANTVNAVSGLIDELMQVKFLAAEGPSAQVEKAWRTFLSFANIVLVIAFLIIIFSQATQAGLSNYNVKRMLPRLVAAAILMNLSFYICAFLVDISNIVGASIMGLFVADQGSISASIGTLVSDGGGGAGGLFGSLAAGAILIGILIFILPFVLMSILSVFILLVGRQVVLMCLVLVSSFAFVAWLLPNTENYFQKWWKLFVQLLIIYPMIMLVFGASLYLSNLIGSEAGIGIVSSDENAGVAGGALQRIVQLVILMIPLFALPGLLKGSNAVMGKIGNAADRVGRDLRVDKLGGKVQGGVTGAMKRGALNTEARMATSDGRLGKIGRYRYARGKKRENAEALRKKIQDDAYFKQRSGTHQPEKDTAEKSIPMMLRNTEAGKAFVGRIGAVGSRAALDEALDLEHKKIQVDFAPGNTNGLLDELNNALSNNEVVRSQALFKRLNSEGKGAVAQAGDLLVQHASNGTFRNNPELERAIAEQRQADWGTVKGADPVLASLDLKTGQSTPSVAPEDLGSMAGPRLEQLAANGTITKEIVGEAVATGKLGNLDGPRRQQLERGLNDTIENIGTQYSRTRTSPPPNP